MRARDLKRWRPGDRLSYAFGAFCVLELLARRPRAVRLVVVDPAAEDGAGVRRIRDTCERRGIEVAVDARTVESLSRKGNTWVLAAFEPWADGLDASSDHVLLVEPSDPGNLGTILRTMAGLGVHDLAVVPPAVDSWDPRVVRASMGSRFAVRVAPVDGAAAYAARYPGRTLYPFVTDGAARLGEVGFASPATLVFGPEAAGLDAAEHALGPTVTIPQSPDVDSFNLAVAAALALWELRRPTPPA